ncbi:short-chain dehydrogenase TIC 32, chloroplastic-like isoform X2 [Photinus pyralis]|uniref:short-chain dehydrogenase TIC 32, chloroplastic-like isoform X2 n=1 Tax=Photinus pyralis TaxID=7054 RepID=UPI00126757F3|nr:short-chain dehydrogenase TIC 32, chloroplastic-like isoform X2 [Photinus pyralis]
MKPLKHLLTEIVFEVRYNFLGMLSVLDDLVLQEKENSEELLMSNGKIALITGGTRGIGAQVVRKLLQRDLHVIIGCRNVEAGQKLCEIYRAKGVRTGSFDVQHLDLNSLSSVRAFAKVIKEKYPRINILINNAGIMFGPYKVSEDGYESQLATNYIGHFLLTHLLLPEMIKAGREDKRYSRIVNVSSCAHKLGDIDFEDFNFKKHYIPSQAYAQSKLAQVLFSNYLNSLMRDASRWVGVYSVHPGIVNTDLFNQWHFEVLLNKHVRRLFFKTPETGSISVVYACLSRKLEIATGTYISNSQITSMSASAYSTDLQRRLFEFTMNKLNIREFGVE